jgi:hypothetical protein
MSLFWKRNKERALNPRQEKIAGKIASVIIRRQIQVAGYLNRKTQYWNKTSKVIALLVFCMVFGGISLYLLIEACN